MEWAGVGGAAHYRSYQAAGTFFELNDEQQESGITTRVSGTKIPRTRLDWPLSRCSCCTRLFKPSPAYCINEMCQQLCCRRGQSRDSYHVRRTQQGNIETFVYGPAKSHPAIRQLPKSSKLYVNRGGCTQSWPTRHLLPALLQVLHERGLVKRNERGMETETTFA